jgi:hypothetical protein
MRKNFEEKLFSDFELGQILGFCAIRDSVFFEILGFKIL